jgi:hypothetical protein
MKLFEMAKVEKIENCIYYVMPKEMEIMKNVPSQMNMKATRSFIV